MVVYRHFRNDTKQVFYIGIGKNEKRPFSKRDRNQYWKSIVKKHGYSVEIIAETETWEDACDLEKLLISEYGRKDLGTGYLVNLTNGGDGTLGAIKSEKAKFKSQETREKISKSLIGRKQSEETKLKRIKSLKKVWQNQDLRDLKRKQTKELIEKGVLSKSGIPSKKKGKPFSGDKKKLSESLKKYYETSKPHNFKEIDQLLIESIKFDYKNGMLKFHLHKKYSLNRKIIDRILCD